MKIATKMPSHWLSAHVLSTLPIFITTNLAAIGIWLLNISEHSMPLILGIIAGGLVDLDNNLSGRFKNLIITLLLLRFRPQGQRFLWNLAGFLYRLRCSAPLFW